MNEVIKIENLSKIFKMGNQEIRAVDNVNLGIGESEFLAIMGPSGSGKTTLLNLIGLLDLPTEGKIFLERKDTSRLKEKDLNLLRLRKIGFIFQTFNLLSNLTVLENVIFPMILAGFPKSFQEKRAKQLLSFVGLSQRLFHYPKQLSSGECQRVAIARSLVNQPKILLADEPTGNLDLKSKKEISSLLEKVNLERKIAILLVTHDQEIAKVAQKIFKMVNGKILVMDQT